VPFFFDKSSKVVAPVRGGGKGSIMGKTVAIKPQAQPLSFGDFKAKTA
jgi:hypothetical protein